jgi:prepilin-type N-terminal cleavage/methylation domain-containing protein
MSARRSESGFTLIELLIVLTILSTLVRLAIPAYQSLEMNAIVSQAAGDLHVVRAAAAAEYAATGNYAPDAMGGVTPPAMAPYLPAGFTFQPKDYELDWENFAVADTTGPNGMGQILALTVTAKDPALGNRILEKLGANCTHWSVGNSHTFVIQSTLEAPR